MYNFLKKNFLTFKGEEPLLFEYDKELPILISSQLQRSGGSLFTQLFDNHPEILSHPWEIMVYKEGFGNFKAKILKTKKEFLKLSIEGYKKGKHTKKKHRFYFLSANFADKLLKIKDDIKFFDFYFDNFFKYWINYKNDVIKKKLITGFTPFFCKNNLIKVMSQNKRLNIIHIYRKPQSWWSSAKFYKKIYNDIDAVEKYWSVSQFEAINAKLIYPNRVHIVNFDDIIVKRKKLMLYFCKKFSLKFNESMMFPTFNGDLIENDSTFKDQKLDKYGIIKGITKRHRNLLNKSDISSIKNKTSKICNQIEKLIINL